MSKVPRKTIMHPIPYNTQKNYPNATGNKRTTQMRAAYDIRERERRRKHTRHDSKASTAEKTDTKSNTAPAQITQT